MSLQKAIDALASNFVRQLLGAFRNASLEDISAATGKRLAGAAPATRGSAKITGTRKGKLGRLPRRTQDDITETAGKIVALLKSKPAGLRAEQIRQALSLDPRELPRPIQDALDARLIGKKGEKRATTYFAGSKAPASKTKSKKK